LTFGFSKPEEGLFKLENYAGKAKNLGSEIKLPPLSEGSDKTLGDVATRIVSAVYDVGTMEKVFQQM
jgi:hypothetical protein